MNILFVLDYYQPKLGYSEHYLALELVRMGHKVTILTSDRYFPFPAYESTVGKILGNRFVGAGRKNVNGIEIVRKPVIIEAFCRTVFIGHEDVLRLYQPEIVFVNGTATYHAIILAQLKTKHKFILKTFDSHLPSEFDRTDGVAKRMLYGIFRLCFSRLLNERIDAFIAVQDDTVKLMREMYGVHKRIQLIDLGTDTRLFSYTAAGRKKLRMELKLKNNDVAVLYTGKIIEAKGVHILLDAFGLIEKIHINLHLVFVGDGPEEYIHTACQTVQDKKRLHFVGMQSQENLPAWYSMADFAVWPLQDTTAMNEAASCSLPFIANDALGAKTRISNQNAILYKRGNVKDLAERMTTLYAHPEERKEMGKRGRLLALNKLSWTRIAKKYLKEMS